MQAKCTPGDGTLLLWGPRRELSGGVGVGWQAAGSLPPTHAYALDLGQEQEGQGYLGGCWVYRAHFYVGLLHNTTAPSGSCAVWPF